MKMKNKMVVISQDMLNLINSPIQQVKRSQNNLSAGASRGLERIGEGERNSRLASLLGSFKRQGGGKELAYQYAQNINESLFDPPLEGKEVNKTVDSIYRYEDSLPTYCFSKGIYALTDVGNAQRFKDMYGNIVKYIPEPKQFAIYNGKYWVISYKGEIERMARMVFKTIKEEALKVQDSVKRQALIKHANKSESEQRLKAMINLLKSEENIAMSITEFDKDPKMLNCNNGTINLRTGQLMPHQAENYFMKIINVDYNQNAQCPMFISFLNKIFKNNDRVIGYLKRVIGYSLAGLTNEQCLFILQGVGSNGKSVLIDVLRALFNNYSCNAEFKTFTKQASQSIRNDVARMANARFVTAVEGDKKASLDESLIKAMTGGDTITARFLHKEFFDYEPTFKIFLVTNFLPKISNSGHSIWRRIKIINFDVIISKAEQDKDLTNKLKTELSGILNWAIEGCLEWQKSSLKEPQEVTNAVNKYKTSVDSANVFVKNCCILSPQSNVQFSHIYKDYCEWCEDNLYDTVPAKEFAHVLLENNCVSYRGYQNGDRGYTGIEVKSQFITPV